jgi:hypothetical protein
MTNAYNTKTIINSLIPAVDKKKNSHRKSGNTEKIRCPNVKHRNIQLNNAFILEFKIRSVRLSVCPLIPSCFSKTMGQNNTKNYSLKGNREYVAHLLSTAN